MFLPAESPSTLHNHLFLWIKITRDRQRAKQFSRIFPCMLYTIIIQGYPSFTQTIQSNGYSSFTNSQVCPLIKSINFSATSSTRPLSQLYLTSLPKHFLRTFMATVSLTSTDLSCPLSSKKTSLCPALFRSPSAKALMWRIFPLSSSTWNTTEKMRRRQEKLKRGRCAGGSDGDYIALEDWN